MVWMVPGTILECLLYYEVTGNGSPIKRGENVAAFVSAVDALGRVYKMSHTQ